MKIIRRTCAPIQFLATVFAALAIAVCDHAYSQAYPSKPVTLVVPYGTGGDADLAARVLASAATKYLNNQPIVVMNRPGASGMIGSDFVRTAAPDGYTLLLARIGSHAIVPATESAVPYKWNSFTFLSILELNPFLCVVRADSPYRTLGNLLDAIRQAPGKLNYGSAGAGTIQHFGPQFLLTVAGLKPDAAVHIPYKGGGQALVGLLGGEIDFQCQSMAPLIGQMKSGKIRALVTTMAERLKDAPDVPTARELGFPQLEKLIGWSALYGPPGLPKEVVATWAEVMQKVAKDPEWIQGNARIGGIPGVRSPEETENFAREQYELFRSLAAATPSAK